MFRENKPEVLKLDVINIMSACLNCSGGDFSKEFFIETVSKIWDETLKSNPDYLRCQILKYHTESIDSHLRDVLKDFSGEEKEDDDDDDEKELNDEILKIIKSIKGD